MKVLITGGAGFIGSNLAKYFLKEGVAVVILDNLSTGTRENIPDHRDLTFVKGDILDTKVLEHAIAGCDRVCHLAAAVGNVRSIETPEQDSRINVLGTLSVLDAARKTGIRKFVYSSSAAIFGEPMALPLDEEHPLAPDSPYGVSKLAGELHARCYAKLYDMDVICLRYFNVYGPNQRFDAYGNVIPIFATKKRKGEPFTIYGDGEQTRDFVHVEDVAQANFLAATRSNVSGTYNIGSGLSITVNQLANIMNEAGEESAVKVKYMDARKGEVKHSLADIGKARKKLGYAPARELESGLADYMKWMRSL